MWGIYIRYKGGSEFTFDRLKRLNNMPEEHRRKEAIEAFEHEVTEADEKAARICLLYGETMVREWIDGGK